jgi:hypothetical protein
MRDIVQVPETELRTFTDLMRKHHHNQSIGGVVRMAQEVTSDQTLQSIYQRILDGESMPDLFAAHADALPSDFLHTIKLFWETGDARYFSMWRNPYSIRLRALVEQNPSYFDYKPGDDPIESATIKLERLIHRTAFSDTNVAEEEYRGHKIVVMQNAETIGTDSPTFYVCAYNLSAKQPSASPITGLKNIEEAKAAGRRKVDKKLDRKSATKSTR